MVWERNRLVLAAAVLAMTWIQPLVAQEPTPYESATFTFSSDPSNVVLYVRHAGGMAGTNRSMTLHGDGRLVLKNGTGPHITEEYSRQLDFQEVQRLLRLAVDHGLAEWDGTRILAQQYDLNNGKAFSAPTDGLTALILLSIDDYKRGDYRLEGVEQRIQLYEPKSIDKRYPPILEIRGIVALVNYMESTLRAAMEAGQ